MIAFIDKTIFTEVYFPRQSWTSVKNSQNLRTSQDFPGQKSNSTNVVTLFKKMSLWFSINSAKNVHFWTLVLEAILILKKIRFQRVTDI